ncbi:Aste57867_10353 [Aphanomyces stellatus]|uniref:protein-tyrosine-phosphatase n=1 Tax=Aphanomyces stellatus TaxID=120398 RepID=A0A485KR30_9STRA|nr:hypothetical protein As57867_010313 [Aphanomyces stellatus]VFT87227.1 Aste57867_10353 [Aphanomyces stellatus]
MERLAIIDGVDFAVVEDWDTFVAPQQQDGEVWIALENDESLHYTRYFADFGPLNLAQTYRFGLRLQVIVQSCRRAVCYCSTHRHRLTNAVTLLTLYCVLFRGQRAADAVRSFHSLQKHLIPYRDAAFTICTFGVTVLDCALAVEKAMQSGLWDKQTFDVEWYERHSKLEFGDLNWIVPGKLLAFSGPLAQKREVAPNAYALIAEDYAKLFKSLGVSCVVRLNEQCYDRKKFVHAGLTHVDLIYPDGSTPSDGLLAKFISICDRELGAVAVHCKAGLGRTGTNIAAFLIKRYRLTASEAIAWVRLCRPGSIVGPQQHFLELKQTKLWQMQPQSVSPPPIRKHSKRQVAAKTSKQVLTTDLKAALTLN